MYLSVCQYQKNLIVNRSLLWVNLSPSEKLVQKWAKICRPWEWKTSHSFLVQLHKMFDSIRLLFVGIAAQRKAMINLFWSYHRKVCRSSEAISRDPLVWIIIKEDCGDCLNGGLILIRSHWRNMVQWERIIRLSVGGGEIDGDWKIQLQPTPQVV